MGEKGDRGDKGDRDKRKDRRSDKSDHDRSERRRQKERERRKREKQQARDRERERRAAAAAAAAAEEENKQSRKIVVGAEAIAANNSKLAPQLSNAISIDLKSGQPVHQLPNIKDSHRRAGSDSYELSSSNVTKSKPSKSSKSFDISSFKAKHSALLCCMWECKGSVNNCIQLTQMATIERGYYTVQGTTTTATPQTSYQSESRPSTAIAARTTDTAGITPTAASTATVRIVITRKRAVEGMGTENHIASTMRTNRARGIDERRRSVLWSKLRSI